MRPVVHMFGPIAGLKDAVEKAKDGDMYHADGEDFVLKTISGVKGWLPVVDVRKEELTPDKAPCVLGPINEGPQPVAEEPVEEAEPVPEESVEEPKPKKKRTKKEK